LKGGVGSGPEAFRKLGLIKELQGLGKLPFMYTKTTGKIKYENTTRAKVLDVTDG
jgi:hypothetical protein